MVSSGLSWKGKIKMLPFHAFSWSASQGISGYLSGMTPADHLFTAIIKPVVRKARRNYLECY
jgi:hypothetical protein